MIITTDGDYEFPSKSCISVFYVSGAIGAATAALGYKNESGTFVPLETTEAVGVGKQYHVQHGCQVLLELRVTGADGATNLDVILSGIS